MSFVPQGIIDSSAVLGSLRVGFANNVHASEHLFGVTLDSAGEIARQSAIYADTAILSAIELQQHLLEARTCRDVWNQMADHNGRLHDAYFKFLHECFACRSRAIERLTTGGSYVES